jgi:hypothetical protein
MDKICLQWKRKPFKTINLIGENFDFNFYAFGKRKGNLSRIFFLQSKGGEKRDLQTKIEGKIKQKKVLKELSFLKRKNMRHW